MKSGDALIDSWEETLARKGDAPAIFDTRGAVSLTFREIEEQARLFEQKWRALAPGRVNAIQIGNHPDWPAMLIASLRKRLPVLPLDKSVSAQERENAIASAATTASRRLGSRPTVAFQTYLRHDSRTPRHSLSQRTVAGRLRQHLRDDGNYGADRNFARHSALPLVRIQQSYYAAYRARSSDGLEFGSDAARDPARSGKNWSDRFPRHASSLPGVL